MFPFASTWIHLATIVCVTIAYNFQACYDNGGAVPAVSNSYTMTSQPPAGWPGPFSSAATFNPNAPSAARINWDALYPTGDPPAQTDSTAALRAITGVMENSTTLMHFKISKTAAYTATHTGLDGFGTSGTREGDTYASYADESFPIIFVDDTLPGVQSYTVHCNTPYGETATPCGLNAVGPDGVSNMDGSVVPIPNGVYPQLNSDHHFVLLNEKKGYGCGFWGMETGVTDPASYDATRMGSAGATSNGILYIRRGGCFALSAQMDGVCCERVSMLADGEEAAQYTMRAEDMLSNTFTHAAYVSIGSNLNQTVWPATANDGKCSSGSYLREGELIKMTRSGYNKLLASSLNPIMKAIWTMVFKYGVRDADSSNNTCGGAPYNNTAVDGPAAYIPAGLSSPWDTVIANLQADSVTAPSVQCTQGCTNGFQISLDYSLFGATINDFEVVQDSCSQYWVKGTGSCGSGTTTPVATYAGCTMYPAGDWYNADVSNAPVDPNSATQISQTNTAAGNQNFVFSIGIERLNLATNATTTWTVQGENVPGQTYWHSSEFAGVPWPWQSGYYIEGTVQAGGTASDEHGLVLNTDTCHLYETYWTYFPGTSFHAYSGGNWNLASNFVGFAPSAMASGLTLFGGAIKWDYELANGQLNHALNFFIPQYTNGPGVNAPAVSSGSNGSSGIPYGAHLRLHSSYPETGSAQLILVIKALKKYGMFMADTSSQVSSGGQIGFYTITPQDGNNGHYSFGTPTFKLTDFDLIPPSVK